MSTQADFSQYDDSSDTEASDGSDDSDSAGRSEIDQPDIVNDTAVTMRGKMVDAFGEGAPEVDTVDADAVSNDDNTVLWLPEGSEDMTGDPPATYDAETRWTQTFTRKMNAVYVVTNGDVQQVLDADYVDRVADVLDITPAELMESAAVKPGREVFPVLFDIAVGNVLITPT